MIISKRWLVKKKLSASMMTKGAATRRMNIAFFLCLVRAKAQDKGINAKISVDKSFPINPSVWRYGLSSKTSMIARMM